MLICLVVAAVIIFAAGCSTIPPWTERYHENSALLRRLFPDLQLSTKGVTRRKDDEREHDRNLKRPH